MSAAVWRPPRVVEALGKALDESAEPSVASQSTLPVARSVEPYAGLLASLRMAPGTTVRIGPGEAPRLARALVRRGCRVLGDGEHARDGADIVAIVPQTRPITSAIAAEILREHVDWAKRTVADDGVIVLDVANAQRLLRMITVSESDQQLPWPSRGDDPLTVIGTVLDAAGYEHQRRLSMFPDAPRASVVVADSAFNDPQAAQLAAAFVREPAATATTGVVPVIDSSEAFRMACAGGVGAVVAGSYVVVAAQQPEPLIRAIRDAELWSLGHVDRAQQWRDGRELVRQGVDWIWRPLDPVDSARSGPFTLAAEPCAVVPGANGEDLLRGDRWEGEAMGVSLRAWWDAALLALDEDSRGFRQFDIRPRNFTVDSTGRWCFIPQGLTIRFALPRTIAAYRALHHAVVSAGLWVACLSRLKSTATVRDAVTMLLHDIGIAVDEATVLGWVEFETDLRLRTGSVFDDRARARSWLWQLDATPLRALGSALPLAGRLRVALWAASASGAERLESERITDLEARLAQTEKRLRRRVAAAEGMAADVAALEAELAELRGQSESPRQHPSAS